MQRSSSADRRRPTPPPATVRELRSTLQRSASSQSNVTSAVDFSAAGSRPVSPQPRASSASRASSPSREQYQQLVRATYFGYESTYPNEADVQRKQQTAGLRPPRLVEKPFPPKFTHYRGHQRCRHCSTLVPIPSMAEHVNECSLAPVACPLVDSETGAPCGVVCRGRELLHEHLLTCGARTKHCENRGCGKLVSVQSVTIHLQKCSFERVRCLHCHVLFPRSEGAVHMDVCPQEVVSCPLGCGASLRRGDVLAHMHNQLWIHKASPTDPTKLAPEAPGSVIQFLLHRLLDMHEASLKRRAGGGGGGALSQIPSLNGSRCITPTFSQVRGGDAKHPAVSTSGGLPVSSAKLLSDDAPSSIQENPVEDDLSVIGDAEVEGLKPPPPLRSSSQTAAAPTVDREPVASLSSSPAKQPRTAGGCRSAFRDRSDFHQPIQSIPFQVLFEHIMSELKWAQRELSSMVEEARVKHIHDSAETSGDAVAAVDHRWDSPNLSQEVSDRLQYLRQIVDALLARSNFEGLAKHTGEMKQEEVEREWKKLDRVWYEWKLVLYERMYLGPS